MLGASLESTTFLQFLGRLAERRCSNESRGLALACTTCGVPRYEWRLMRWWLPWKEGAETEEVQALFIATDAFMYIG